MEAPAAWSKTRWSTRARKKRRDYGVIKEKIRADLKRYINKQSQKRPLIMPVILEI